MKLNVPGALGKRLRMGVHFLDAVGRCALRGEKTVIDVNVGFADNIESVPCQQVVNVIDRTGGGIFQRKHAEISVFLRYRFENVLKSRKEHRFHIIPEELLRREVGIRADSALTGDFGAFDDLAGGHEFLAELAVVAVEKHLLIGAADVDQGSHERTRTAAEFAAFALHTFQNGLFALGLKDRCAAALFDRRDFFRRVHSLHEQIKNLFVYAVYFGADVGKVEVFGKVGKM